MFNDVSLFDAAFKLNRLTMICFVVGAGFIIFMGPLRGVLFRIFFKYFTLLRGVSGAMQQACFSAPVVFLLVDTALLVLHFLSRPFSGLTGEEVSPTFPP